MKIQVILEPSDEGGFTAIVPSLPGCISEGMTGDELKEFIDRKLIAQLKNLDVSSGNKRVLIIREIFDGTNNYMKNGTIIRQVINQLNQIDFNKTEDRHVFGDIYETILRDLQSAGNYGEFYTPPCLNRVYYRND